MTYGITIDAVSPTEAFGCVITQRVISPPQKRIVKETVPCMDGDYDLSEIGGRAFYEPRSLQYTLAVLADEPTELFAKVAEVEAWLWSVCDGELADEVLEGWHFKGVSTVKVSTSTVGTTGARITAALTCYPFRVSDELHSAALVVGDNVVSNAGRRVLLTGASEGTTILTANGVTQTFTGNVDLEIALESGSNVVSLTGDPCTVTWREERI